MADALLIVKRRVPFPVDTGTDAVSYANWRALAGSFALTVVAADEGARSRAGAAHLRSLGIDVRLAPPGRAPGRIARNLKRLLLGLPGEHQATACPAFGPLVDDLTRRRTFALAQFEYWTAARYRRFARCPALLLNHDVWHETVARIARHQASAWRRALWGLEARTTRRHELAANRACEARLFVSEEDRALMARLGIDGDVLPVLFPFAPAERSAEGEEPVVLLAGDMSAPFNVEAACRFTARVWPAVRAEEPRARFVVAGRDPTPAVRACAREPGVEVTGAVPDLGDALARAWVAVSPGGLGTGVKVKVAHAMAAGVPVVGTAAGLSGFGTAPGLVRADSDADLAREVAGLLRDAPRRRALARSALAFYEERLWIERGGARVGALYRSILDSVESARRERG